MAEREGGGVDLESSSRASDSTDEVLVAMETLLATLRAFEDVLRLQDISATSSSEYCDNFCQALMHYAGNRNSVEHGLPLLEVYCLSISCFASARSHLTVQSDSVALVLKRLALSCFELLLTVHENEIPYEAWVQFNNSVQVAHEILQHFGSMDLQALVQITGEGGAWSNPVLTALLTGQPTAPQDVNAYIGLEGEGFMEMRVKHLEKIGELAKAVVLAKSCSDCCHVSNQATFRQHFVSLLCQLLPNEEAITEISKLQCKDVLEITSNLLKEGDGNIAFILCTTFLTQQLQQQSHSSSWELTLLWSKLQRKIDPPPESLLERCLQLGAIANTVQHLLYLIMVIQTETKELGLASSVELCVKALQLPKQDDSESRISVLKTVSGLLKDDLEVVRACLLTEFLLGPLPEVFSRLQELHLRPDQKYDQENGLIPNSLRCELLLALKAYWPFDPEFWDWKTLRRHCSGILGLSPEEEEEEKHEMVKHEAQDEGSMRVASREQHCLNGAAERRGDKGPHGVTGRHKKNKLLCKICKKSVSGGQMIVHSRRHADDPSHPCPVCMRVFDNRKDIVSHIKHHIRSFVNSRKKLEKDNWPQASDGDEDIEPGEIKADPSLLMYYKSTKDPDVLHHIVQQSKDEDELITFNYIDSHFELQNRDEYPCPGTNCLKNFKHSKYLYVHLKSDHRGDENVKHFHEMRDRREKCIFCRRHFVSNYHHRKHRKIHYNEQPYMCTVIGCGTQFKTSHELADHKHSHGYQLNFQCQLKGCYVTFSDLGQLYHHEAQHFREAAFTCTSPECKKYYLSRKEFNDHLSTHGITFSEKDFETQRKAKRELFARGDKVTSKGLEQEEEDGGGSSSSRCASSWDASSCKGPKGTVTSVAVCFDGSKFTCGFERCGMTFSRARDVQRHFKCAHPEHLKLENKDDHHDKERDSKSKSLKVETKQTNEQKGKRESSSPLPLKAEKENNKSSQLNCSETNSTSLCQNDALKDILLGLRKLDLNSVGSSDGPLEPSKVLHLSYCKAIMARSPVVVLQKRPPHMFVDRVKVKIGRATEEVNLNVGESLATAKPYVCKIYGCDFRTAQSFSLLRHHVIIHSYTMEQAKRFTSIDSFKPFLCQICSKGHKEKINLRLHYIQAHNLSKAAIEKINCASVKPVRSRAADTSQQLKDGPQVRKRAALSWQQRYQKRKKAVVLRRDPRKEVVFDHPSASEEEEEVEEVEEETEQANGISNNTSEQKEEKRDGPSQVRTTRRHNAKSNLCYILNKFNKPFHCVVKDCNSAFSTQGGLVRHLQIFHHYNRSQLVLDKDPDPPRHTDVKKDAAKNEPLSHSDEPQPQFQCRFANCQASYHLKSSLVRHTQQQHCQPPEPLQCSYEGCARVFSHASSLKKHILYTHCEYYDSLVLRLQSTHKKPLVGCQKDSLDAANGIKEETTVSELVTPISELVTPVSELVTPVSELVTPVSELVTPVFEPMPPVSELVPPVFALLPLAVLKEEATPSGDTEDEPIKPISKRNARKFQLDTLRSQDEALQMCQPKHLRSHYPCMIRNCDSVVKYLNSLHRHYFRVHHICKTDLEKHGDKLLLTFEQLEDLTGRKCALPPVAAVCTSNGVHRMEYQAEQQGPHVPVSLNFIQSETLDDQDPDPLEPSPGERNVLLRADDVLYGEPGPGGPKEEPALEIQNGNTSEERSKHQNTLPLTPVVTVNLSPPSALRFASDEGLRDSSCSKDVVKSMNESVANPAVRLPLKRKNELSEPCNLPEAPSHLSFKTFDIGTYRPMGFESSFLQFIQDADDMEDEFSPIKRKDSLRRSCSVKENNQLGVALTRSRRTRSPPLKPQAPAEGQAAEGLMTEEVMTELQLKSILDRALAGCGGPALEQLQYLRPVVVLDRRLWSASSPLPDLMTPDSLVSN